LTHKRDFPIFSLLESNVLSNTLHMQLDDESTMNRKSKIVCVTMALVAAAVVTIVYAQPFLDGDLFWHMAYARQMLDHGTLQLDHAAFSWTPASNGMIYCAWASELILYAMWNQLGAWSLFALRYLVIFFVIGLLWDHARRLKMADQPMTYLVLLMTSLVLGAGTIIKPELFSLLFMNLVVWAFYRARQAMRQGASPRKWFYLVPALVALWVNFHGAFILLAPFLIATAIGEGLNLLLSEGKSPTPRNYRDLLLAWGLCGAANLMTPYGVRYPLQLFQDVILGRTQRPDEVWNAAMGSVFAETGPGLNLWELGLVMFLLLAGVMVVRALSTPLRRTAIDWTLLFTNAAYLLLFIVYLRSTWLWAPVFAYGFIFAAAEIREGFASPGGCERSPHRTMLSKRPPLDVAAAQIKPWSRRIQWSARLVRPAWQRELTWGVSLVFLMVSGAAVWGAWYYPVERSWTGFGISYWNPVPEAEFLAASKLGPRVINLFDSGGYLLWRLWPKYLVMIDQRSFPYLSWFDEQYKFTTGGIFDEFLAAHPADVAVIDLRKAQVWRNFLRAKGWKLAYYGPTAAVFVHDSVKAEALAAGVAPERFRHLRNARVAWQVFEFAVTVGDYRTAWDVETQMASQLRFQAKPDELSRAGNYRQAHRALREHNYTQASTLFHAALEGLTVCDRDRLILLFIGNIEKLAKEGRRDQTVTFEAALGKLAAPE
jgi:hypothetical protein